jgi:hypothetical protein
MTHSDPPSDPNRISPIDDEAEALWEPLTGRNESPAKDSVEDTNPFKDEERLYTDAIIRQNENASRFLFFSFMMAGLVSIGLGCWYIFAQQQTKPTPLNTPLQVPNVPPLSPALPDLNITPPPLPTSNPSPTETPGILQPPLGTPNTSPPKPKSPEGSSNRSFSQPGNSPKPTGTVQVNPTLPPPPPPTR